MPRVIHVTALKFGCHTLKSRKHKGLRASCDQCDSSPNFLGKSEKLRKI